MSLLVPSAPSYFSLSPTTGGGTPRTTADLSLALTIRDMLVDSGATNVALAMTEQSPRPRTQTTAMRRFVSSYVRQLKQRIQQFDTQAMARGLADDEREACLQLCLALAHVQCIPQTKSLPVFLTLYTVFTENEEDGTSTFNKALMDRYTNMLGTAREWYEVKQSTVDASQIMLDETRVLRRQALQWVRWIQESARDTIQGETLTSNWILPDEGLNTVEDYLQLWDRALEAYVGPLNTLAFA